jgi:hypothetical protein
LYRSHASFISIIRRALPTRSIPLKKQSSLIIISRHQRMDILQTMCLLANLDPMQTALLLQSIPTTRQPRRVSFDYQPEVIPSASPLDQISGWDTVWYQQTELEDFRKQARFMCRQMRTVLSEPDSRELHLARDQQSRGLEQRFCLERQRRKCMTIRLILKSQVQLRDPCRLAALSQRCTAWAIDLAAEEAARDFVRAYDSSNKRNTHILGDVATTTRRVRQRLS